MRNGKYSKRGVASKTLVLVLALVLTLGCVVGGTIAWLTDKTAEVKNTFTVGDVAITLKETDLDDSQKKEGVSNEYKLIPGETYTKDPTVEVVAGSEDCYLFVKFEENGNAADYITYTSTLTAANGWTQGTGTIPTYVWYRTVLATDTVKSWDLLAGNEITIKDTVTKENMSQADDAELVYTAYAIQLDNIAAAATAWAEVSK